MKKEQRKDKKPCTQLTERALKNLARLIISELENTDISRGIRNRKKTPSCRKPHGFLNTRIPSIAPDLYVENDRDVTVNVTTKENLDFLYRSAIKYAQLLDVELPYHPVGRTSIREKICLLYNALDSIVSHHVNLELVGDRLQFCIYHFHEWPDYTLFLIPIDFTERLKGEIKRITLEFIRRFIKYHRMMDITDTP